MDGYLKEMLASDFLEAVMRFETLVFIEKLYFLEQTFNYVGHTKTTFT